MRRRARGEGTLYREADPKRATKWRAEKTVVVNDRSIRITARGRTQDEALLALRRKEDETLRANPSADRMTLAFYLSKWLDFKRPQVAANTMAEYERCVRHVNARIGHVRLTRLTPTDVQGVLSDLVLTDRVGTANAVRRYLKGALTQAERWELIPANPLRNVRPVRVAGREGIAWEAGEIRAFLEAVRHTRYYPLFHTAIFTGLRIGELLALRWSDVREDEVVVERTYARHAEGRVNRPKSKASARRVPISPEVRCVILEGRAGSRSELAFPSARGTMLSYANVRRALNDGVDRANAERPRVRAVTLHDLRRTAATLWAMNGATPKAIQRYLGHESPHLALRVYTMVHEAQLRSGALDPASVLGGGVSGGSRGGRDVAGVDGVRDE